MLARVVMVTFSLVVAGNRTATAQALCPEAVAPGFQLQLPHAPSIVTVEADLAAVGGTLPGSTWRMPLSGGIAADGLMLEGVTFTRKAHAFDVVVELRASDRILVGLEFVLVDGERTLRLGAFTDIAVRCEAKSVSQTISISDDDFATFFAGGRAPTLRVKRTAVVGGC